MLYVQDLSIIKNRRISQNYLYTIRKGELVKDNINNQGLLKTESELIKIKENVSLKKGCVFFSDSETACTIYPDRPSQCRSLKCWDTVDFMKLQKEPALRRADIIEDRILLGLIEEHEKRCDYSILEGEVENIEQNGQSAVEKVLDILRFDYEIRPFISRKLGLDPCDMDLFFGRPLVDTMTVFGLEVINRPDGTFFLTVKKEG